MGSANGSSPSTISVAREGRVEIISLNRPDQMNALSRELIAELHAEINRADEDETVGAIVLTGSGRAFSAGYDLGGDEASPNDGSERRADVLRRYWNRSKSENRHLELMRLGTPVIAAVNGWCLGGGLWYALCADITIASDQAVFGQPEVREINNSTFLLAALCGWKVAHRWALTGDHFDAQEALRVGVVNEVVPHEQLMEKALALASRVALVPSDSVRLNKAITTVGLETMGLSAAMQTARLISVMLFSSTDTRDLDELHRIREEEGMRASLAFRDNPFLPEPGGPRSKTRT